MYIVANEKSFYKLKLEETLSANITLYNFMKTIYLNYIFIQFDGITSIQMYIIDPSIIKGIALVCL